MSNDAELIRRFTETGSEAAFRELVERHLNLVYSTALRLVGGDPHLAQDVAQSVFTDLARKAVQLGHRFSDKEQVLSGWLYTSTRFAAAKAVRAEHCRRAHEQEAHEMHQILHGQDANPETKWAELRLVLDDAMGELASTDRDAVLLRFFEGKDLRVVGEQLGLSEDAARKRVSRSLEKFRDILSRRGVKTSTAALAVLSARAVEAAPAGVAAALTKSALSAAAAASGGTILSQTLNTLHAMTTTKATVVTTTALAVALCIPTVTQWRANRELRRELATVRTQLADKQITQTANLARSALRRPAGGTLAPPSTAAPGSEFDAFLQELNRLDGSPGSMMALLRLGSRILELSPDHLAKAWDTILTSRSMEAKQLLLPLLAVRWHQLQPQEALARIESITEPALKTAAYQAVLMESWVPKDAAGALSWVLGLKDTAQRETLSRTVLQTFALVDPQRAFEAVATFSEPAKRRELLLNVVSTCAQRDPQLAAQLCNLACGEPFFAELVAGFTRGWAATDPKAAMQYALNLPEGLRNESVSTVVGAWCAQDPEAAAAFLQNPRSGMSARDLAYKIGGPLGKLEADRVLELTRHLPEGDARQIAVSGAVFDMGRRDPQGAARLAESLGEGAGRNQAMLIAAQHWTRSDPTAAAEWLNSLPTTESRDYAVYGFVIEQVKSDPQGAVRWAECLRDGNQRQQLLEQVAADWLRRDRPAATPWLQGTTALTDERKKALTEGGSKR